MPGCDSSSSGSVSWSRPSPPGKSVAATSWKLRLHRVEGLGETPLDRLGQLGAELLELGEARLEILALRRELVEPRALGVVLLLRERVHLAERLAAALEALRALGELVAVVALGALVGARMLEAAARLVGLGFDARDLDVDRGHGLRGARQRLAQLDLGRAEPAQLVAELARACAARVDVRAKRRFEARSRFGGGGERRVEPLCPGEHTRELMRTRAPPACADGGVDASGFGRPRALAELRGLGCGGVVRGDERARLVAVAVRLGARERAAEPREVALGGRPTLRPRRRARGAARLRHRRARATWRRAQPCGPRPLRRVRAAAPRRRRPHGRAPRARARGAWPRRAEP